MWKISETNLKSIVEPLDQKYGKNNFGPSLHFYTLSKNPKTKTFLMFFWGPETHDWAKMGWRDEKNINEIFLISVILYYTN